MWRFIVGLLATVGFLTLLAIGGAVAFLSSGPFAAKPLPSPVVLSLDLRRVPEESVSGGLLGGGLWRSSRDMGETLELLWQAADDPRVVGLFVEIGDDNAGLGRVQELRQALGRFRGKGKFAIGFAEQLGGAGSNIADYYLASALDQIWLQPSGGFSVTGIAVETPFLKSGLERLGVAIEGGKRWEYKSAPDSFTETGYTGPARENLQQLIDSLYGQFIEDVARDRRMEPARLRTLIDNAPFASERARAEGLVDKTGYRTDVIDEIARRAGGKRELVKLEDYAADDGRPRPSGGVIALVRATGPIVSGPPDDSPLDSGALANAADVVEALEDAAKDKDVKAIVLRIDSPGGTYPAADAIAAAVASARGLGKPVVASMGDVAASGGYLAAVKADVIVAQPSTITGSIGVFGVWPVTAELMTSLGVNVQRLRAGANAGMYSAFLPPTQAQRDAVGRELDAIYADFTRQVREARKIEDAKLDAAARGRVFSGVDAKRVGLIDELGGLQTALGIAKAKAGLDEAQSIQIRRFPSADERWHRLIERLLHLSAVDAGPKVRLPREVREALARLGIVARPGNVRLPPLPPLWH